MKISEYRKRAYQLMGVDPETYKGSVLLPTQISQYCDHRRDQEMLMKLGEAHIHLLNRRKNDPR